MTPRISRRGVLAGGLGLLAAAGGGVGWAANRYLVPHQAVANANQIGTEDVATEAADGTVDGLSYSSDTATVTIERITTGSGSSAVVGFVADVVVSDATILRTAFADDAFGTNIIATTSTIAQQAGAILAVNGDYYGFRDTGIVIRNGTAFRDAGARQGLLLDRSGELRLYDETATTAATLVADGAWQTWSFGPGLVSGGAVIDGIDQVEIDTNFGNHSVQGTQPRTGIGMVAANHFLLVAVDGRSTGYSRGMTMTELAQLFVDHGATVAYNLDGGGSTTMVFDGDLVNNPVGKGKERATSDIVFVAG